MERRIARSWLSKSVTPGWMCPTCGKGVLNVKKDTFHRDEAKASRDHSDDAWEPDWISYLFSCQFECANPNCKEIVSCAGIGGVELYNVETSEGYETEYEEVFRPQYFQPHLKLFELNADVPAEVGELLNESFRLLFVSPSASLNAVRSSVEALLTALKVKRFVAARGRRRIVSLHNRIELLPSQYVHIKEQLSAIKWLGNSGSHAKPDGSEITIDDVMDAYELIEHVLKEIYVKDRNKIRTLAKKINKNKGVKRKKVKFGHF